MWKNDIKIISYPFQVSMSISQKLHHFLNMRLWFATVVQHSYGNVYIMSMLPSKVMPYLLRLAAPLMDSSIVQTSVIQGKPTFLNQKFPHNYIGYVKP
jgi:hypothetical protein